MKPPQKNSSPECWKAILEHDPRASWARLSSPLRSISLTPIVFRHVNLSNTWRKPTQT